MKYSRRWHGMPVLVACLVTGGCSATGGSGANLPHDTMDAVLWIQTSTEYAAATSSIYGAAEAALRQVVAASPQGAGSMAVVLDVDETVLDNSRYQGQVVLDDSRYQRDTWDQWIEMRDAAAVPGVVDFVKASRDLGVHVVFITNRACRTRAGEARACPQKQDTLINLVAAGVDANADSLYLRGDVPPDRCRALLTEPELEDGTWSSDKTSRRQCVRTTHDIVMLFGDQLGDFTEEGESTSGRQAARTFRVHWGKTWFMLPNPTYGDWRPDNGSDKRALVRGLQ